MSNGFLEAISEYLDEDKLIGDKPNPEPGSSGNPLVLAGMTSIIAHQNNEWAGSILSEGFSLLLNQSKTGVPNKKANCYDEVTHDDLIGITAAYYSLIGLSNTVYHYGSKNMWILSNTGKFYFEALARPWDISVYTLSTDYNKIYRKFILCHIILAVKLYFDGLFIDSDWSGIQKMYLRYSICFGKYKFLDSAFKYWRSRVLKKHGSFKNVLAKYHGENHPFAIYCRD